MVRAQQRFLISIALLVFLAACGQTTLTPTRSASTTAAPGPPAASLTPPRVLPRTVAPTSERMPATAPSIASTSAVAPTTGSDSTTTPNVMPVALPEGSGGIGFDDLRYDATLGQVLVPAGRTGKLDLVDPSTEVVTSIAGFSAQPGFNGGHDDGPTSADAGHGLI
jgi:hypothetical protein